MMTKFKVGDKVRIIRDLYAHLVGAEGIIEEDDGTTDAPYRVRIENDNLHWKYGHALELIEESPSDSERITSLESQVAELQAELQALKKRKKPKYLLNDLLAKYPTPNEQRKAVIERAKAFVADTLTKKASKSHDGAIVVGVYYAMPKFFVNAEKRVVTFVAVSPKYKHKRAKGIAKCAPDDVFNADIGKAIALGRALGLDVSEFENAPKPTEVVVGARILYHGIDYTEVFSVIALNHDNFSVNTGEFLWNYRLTDGTCEIVDDTDAKY